MTKTIVSHHYARRPKAPPKEAQAPTQRGDPAPVNGPVKGHPDTGDSALLWEWAEVRETSRCT